MREYAGISPTIIEVKNFEEISDKLFKELQVGDKIRVADDETKRLFLVSKKSNETIRFTHFEENILTEVFIKNTDGKWAYEKTEETEVGSGDSETYVVAQNIPTEIPNKDVSVPDLTFEQCYALIEHFLNGNTCYVSNRSIGAMRVISANGNPETGKGWLTLDLFQNNINYLITYKISNGIVGIYASDLPTKPIVLTGLSGNFEEDEVVFLRLHDNIIIDWSNPTSTPYYGSHHYLRKTKDTQNEEEIIYENSEIRLVISIDGHSWSIQSNRVFKHKLMVWKNEYNSALGIYLEIIDNNQAPIDTLERIPPAGIAPAKARPTTVYSQSCLYYVKHNSTYAELYVKQTPDTEPVYWDTLDLVFEDNVVQL